MYCQISIKRCRTAVALKSALGRALHYLREQWTYLIRFLKDGRQKLNNNRAERSVKAHCDGSEELVCKYGRRGPEQRDDLQLD